MEKKTRAKRKYGNHRDLGKKFEETIEKLILKYKNGNVYGPPA